jgi:predicted phosphate transport protein (TIGR00153 family)
MAKNKGYNYFEGFSQCAGCAVKNALQLDKTLSDYSLSNAVPCMETIHDTEHESDEIRHVMTENLVREFLPPIERDDITMLINELDNVVDGTDEVMQLMCMYNIEKLRPGVAKLTKLLISCTEALADLTNEFEHFKKSKNIKEKIIEVNNLEAQGDALHFTVVSDLFANCDNAVEILAWKCIYDCFETCFDACEHTADLIEKIILSNS